MNIDTILAAGRIRANVNAGDENNMKLATPESFKAKPGQDTITVTTSGNLTAIKIAGTTHTLAAAVDATDAAAVEKAVIDTLTKNGVKEEISPIVAVSYSGGDLPITHTGQLALEGILLSDVGGGSTLQATTRANTAVPAADYELTLEGAAGPVKYDGGSSALANTPYNYTDGGATDVTTAGTLATDIGTAFTALSVPVVSGSISVTVDTTNEVYRVRFRAKTLDGIVRFGSVDAVQVNSTVIFE